MKDISTAEAVVLTDCFRPSKSPLKASFMTSKSPSKACFSGVSRWFFPQNSGFKKLTLFKRPFQAKKASKKHTYL
jgi:hypothetical protein